MNIEKGIRVNALLDIYGKNLTQKQFDILKNYYAFDYSLAEIGENLNISRQAVSDAIKQGIDALEKYEANIGLLKKLNEIKCLAKSLNGTEKQVAEKIVDILEG